MIDKFERKIDYIRISITDRCNLRCVYCMPETGADWVDRSYILTLEEIVRLAQIFSKVGIKKIKITGGEPLVRRDLVPMIAKLKSIDGIEEVTLTTNGTLLSEQIEDLSKAGVDAINISLDTLDPDYYRSITRIGELRDVTRCISYASEYTDIKFKINCVPLETDKTQSWIKIAELARDNPIDVRFIELMPIGIGGSLHGLDEATLRQTLDRIFGTPELLHGHFGNGPSVYYQYPGFMGKVGFISALSHKFCESCNRVRLTSQGELKQCLQFAYGVDLRAMLRGGASDDEIAAAVRETLYNKPEGHLFGNEEARSLEERIMSQIGG